MNRKSRTPISSELLLTPRFLLPLIDSRAFPNRLNPYADDRATYQPDGRLTAPQFYSHHLLDTKACTRGTAARFNEPGIRRYLREKFEEERWVSDGNDRLSYLVEMAMAARLDYFRTIPEIRLLDFGPSGGAITTLFALRALARHGFLEKTRIFLLDVVPNVISMTCSGDFDFPTGIVSSYQLDFAANGAYKRLVSQAVPVVADFHEYVPLQKFHLILNAYTIHHLNVFDKEDCARWMQAHCEAGGIIAVVDFYVNEFAQYQAWLLRHLRLNPESPAPIESPYFTLDEIKQFFKHTLVFQRDEALVNSWVMVLEKR